VQRLVSVGLLVTRSSLGDLTESSAVIACDIRVITSRLRGHEKSTKHLPVTSAWPVFGAMWYTVGHFNRLVSCTEGTKKHTIAFFCNVKGQI
jgi:hypothetical protein